MTSPDRYLDDLRLGETWTSEPIPMPAGNIIGFGTAYDPQPFHVDEDAARSGPFGGLIASGWHLAAVAMKSFVDSKPYGRTPIVGMGVDELRWLAPVRAGDTLRVQREVIETRVSTTRPDRGVLRTQVRLINQNGDLVMRMVVITQMPTRPRAA